MSGKMKVLIKFATVFSAVITLSALMAHLFELKAKIELPKEHYQIVQGIYRGWQWIGIFELATILLASVWTFLDRKSKTLLPYLVFALTCFVISTTIFFIFTLPTNQATINWTNLDSDWASLRETWEYSHAVRAVLHLTGFSFLILTLLKGERNGRFV